MLVVGLTPIGKRHVCIVAASIVLNGEVRVRAEAYPTPCRALVMAGSNNWFRNFVMGFAPRSIAVFDFDHTLILDDSFWSYLGLAVGWPATILAFLKAIGALLVTQQHDKLLDIRTFFKAQLLERLLKGRTLSDFEVPSHRLRQRLRWNEPILKKLLEHAASGHRIVIASGGLSLYLPLLLKEIPHEALLCTEVGVNNGVITGVMTKGNCVRECKAERLKEYLQQIGPIGESWGYGNMPHDLPMLNLLQHRLIV